MAYPKDLSNVVAFKIHPAIGVARLANNNDYYEFFESEIQRKKWVNTGGAERGDNTPQPQYMSKEQDGRHWIKRQAVQFKIFAYDNAGKELGELTETIMEALQITSKWSAQIANRKLYNWSKGKTDVVEAEAKNVTGKDKARIEGNNPWRSEEKVWMGDLTGSGLFIPPKGGVYRKTAKQIPPYDRTSQYQDNGILDTTSDGSIDVSLKGNGADKCTVIAACIVVAPQQHSPDVMVKDVANDKNTDFIPYTQEQLGIDKQGKLPSGKGYQMDIDMMNTINAHYMPGMEVCITSVTLDKKVNPALSKPELSDIKNAFYSPGKDPHIDPHEIRPNYDAQRGKGNYAKYGALTAGLCSAWQTDLTACLDYWTAEFPSEISAENEQRYLSRKQYTGHKQMKESEDLNAYMDMMGIARDTDDDKTFLYEKERNNNDNAGEEPEKYPLRPTGNQKG